MSPWFLKISLAVLSLPVLIDWVRHVTSHSWATYALAFPVLTILSARLQTPRTPQIVAAHLFAGFGLGIQVWALALGVPRYGRPGLLLCVLALLLIHGRARLRPIVPLMLCIPIPSLMLTQIGSPLAALPAAIFASVLRWSGTPSIADGTRIELPRGAIDLNGTDFGLSAAILGFGLAWPVCQICRLPVVRALIVGLATAMGSVLIHVLTTGAFVVLGSSEGNSEFRLARDFIVYTVLISIALAIARPLHSRQRDQPLATK